jgi:photosystem II stability/assembly factor-like uncharacterized protein
VGPLRVRPCPSRVLLRRWPDLDDVHHDPHQRGAFFAGSIHVGAPGHIIWVSAGSKGASYTTDSGTTWTAVAISGVTMSAINTQAYFYYRRPVASEKTAGSADTFYAFVTGTGFYKSTDVGATWAQQCNNTQFAG